MTALPSVEDIVRAEARRVSGGRREVAEELEQVARIAVLEAAVSWRPDGGMSWRSWAGLLVRRALWRDRRRAWREPAAVSLDAPHATDGGPPRTLYDLVAAPAEDPDLVDLRDALDRLTPEDRATLFTWASRIRSVRMTAEIRVALDRLRRAMLAPDPGPSEARRRRDRDRAALPGWARWLLEGGDAPPVPTIPPLAACPPSGYGIE